MRFQAIFLAGALCAPHFSGETLTAAPTPSPLTISSTQALTLYLTNPFTQPLGKAAWRSSQWAARLLVIAVAVPILPAQNENPGNPLEQLQKSEKVDESRIAIETVMNEFMASAANPEKQARELARLLKPRLSSHGWKTELLREHLSTRAKGPLNPIQRRFLSALAVSFGQRLAFPKEKVEAKSKQAVPTQATEPTPPHAKPMLLPPISRTPTPERETLTLPPLPQPGPRFEKIDFMVLAILSVLVTGLIFSLISRSTRSAKNSEKKAGDDAPLQPPVSSYDGDFLPGSPKDLAIRRMIGDLDDALKISPQKGVEVLIGLLRFLGLFPEAGHGAVTFVGKGRIWDGINPIENPVEQLDAFAPGHPINARGMFVFQGEFGVPIEPADMGIFEKGRIQKSWYSDFVKIFGRMGTVMVVGPNILLKGVLAEFGYLDVLRLGLPAEIYTALQLLADRLFPAHPGGIQVFRYPHTSHHFSAAAA